MRNIGFATRFTSVGLVSTLAWLVRLGCIAAVLLVTADAIWYFVVGPTERTDALTPSQGTRPQVREVNTARILATELFGSSDGAQESDSLANLQETTLSLTLEGTYVATDDRSQSIAFISNRDSRAAAREYRIGDAVASFAEIEEIHPRFVVISRAGERELLTFEIDRVFSEPPLDARTESSVGTRQPTDPMQTPLLQTPSVRELDPKRLQATTIEDLKTLGLTEIQTGDGAMLAITDSSGTSPLARLGMRPGDIVLSVNGHSLDALRSDEKLIEKVRDSNTARLGIKRADRTFFLTVPIP
ncbi:MAG: hypothetical protein OXG15_09505 [Gammaproteobacteria bacterium]|nr:hypothetical protein [Gammaproteobacteria bacterium]